jgi:hypothetical protein
MNNPGRNPKKFGSRFRLALLKLDSRRGDFIFFIILISACAAATQLANFVYRFLGK